MTIRDIAMSRTKVIYSMQSYKGKSLLEWAIIWFKKHVHGMRSTK